MNDYVLVQEVTEGGGLNVYGQYTPLDTLTYDPYGNRRERTVGNETHVYAHNNLHQITGIKNKATHADIATFAYDANGNMVRKSEGGTVTTLGYDALNRLASVEKTGLAKEVYTYDHGIRRIKKMVGSDVQQFHYSGPDIIAEYGSSWNQPTAVYSHGAAVDDPLLRLAANEPRYYHGDALGSIVAVSDGNGNIVGSTLYDHWGNVTVRIGSTPQFGYTGREPDATGLLYYRNRYYDPQIGRFTQPDPKGFIDGINRYTYVMNSPVSYVDPWGLSGNSPTIGGHAGGVYVNVNISGQDQLLAFERSGRIGNNQGYVDVEPVPGYQVAEAGSLTLAAFSLTPCSIFCAGASTAIDVGVAIHQVVVDDDIVGAVLTLLLGAASEAAGRLVKGSGLIIDKVANDKASQAIGVMTNVGTVGVIKNDNHNE